MKRERRVAVPRATRAVLPMRLVPTRPRRELLAADPGQRERLLVVAVAVVRVLTAQPGTSLRKLRLGVRGALGRCTDADTDAAVELLGEGVRFDDGPRGAWKLTLDISQTPPEIRAAVTTGEGEP